MPASTALPIKAMAAMRVFAMSPDARMPDKPTMDEMTKGCQGRCVRAAPSRSMREEMRSSAVMVERNDAMVQTVAIATEAVLPCMSVELRTVSMWHAQNSPKPRYRA